MSTNRRLLWKRVALMLASTGISISLALFVGVVAQEIIQANVEAEAAPPTIPVATIGLRYIPVPEYELECWIYDREDGGGLWCRDTRENIQ